MSEWITFRVGTPSTRQNWSNPDCTPFHAVYHVSHIIPSLSILQNKKIHAGLVFDESKLNKDRLLVSWVSPNHWSPGSRYGTVQFCFDLRQLIQGKNYYWVESIAYGVRACRILVTPNEHKGLAQYDPTVGDGPWWYDKDKDEHYFNGNYCLELMLEEDLAIDAETTIDFVSHHDRWCSIHRYNPAQCRELGMISTTAAGKFLAGIISRNITLSHDLSLLKANDAQVPPSIRAGFSDLWWHLINRKEHTFSGSIVKDTINATSVARAALNAYFLDLDREDAALASLFKGKDDFALAVAQLIGKYTGLDNWPDLMKD